MNTKTKEDIAKYTADRLRFDPTVQNYSDAAKRQEAFDFAGNKIPPQLYTHALALEITDMAMAMIPPLTST